MAFRRKIAELGLIGLLGFFVARGARAAPATNVTMNPVTNNASLTWNWADQYLLEANVIKGTITGGPTGAWYSAIDNITLTNNPNQGYHFVRWYGDVPSGSESNNPLTMTMDTGRGVTASNELNRYTFSYNVSKATLNGETGIFTNHSTYGSSTNLHVVSPNGRIKNISTNGVNVEAPGGKFEKTYDLSIPFISEDYDIDVIGGSKNGVVFRLQ